MTRLTDEARIREAAAKLDRMDSEWYKKIDLDALDMESGVLCILGQLAKSMNPLYVNTDHPLYDCEGSDYFGVFCSQTSKQPWVLEINRRIKHGVDKDVIVKYNGKKTIVKSSDMIFLTKVMKDLGIEDVTVIEEKPLF